MRGGGIVDIRLGDTPVEAVYLGDELVWENVKVEEVIIPYGTSEVKDASKWSDYRAVTTKGQTGLKKVYKKHDGTIVKEEVIAQPVDEVVTVGTRPLYETKRRRESGGKSMKILITKASYSLAE